MGHKVNPIGFRLGFIRDWQAKWYADRHFAAFLQEDLKLRNMIQEKYFEAAISSVMIERQTNQVTVTIRTARPGIVIGRGGQRVEETRHSLERLIGKKVRLNIQEVHQPELDAKLVSRSIAEQMERRVAFRRAMKQSLLRTIQAGAKGVRINCAGRLGGAEIARRLNMHDGQVPLHTLRADIDYGFTEARTTMGRIGVKVWIYKGEILPQPKLAEEITGDTTPPTIEPTLAVDPTPVVEPITEVVPVATAEKKPVRVPTQRKTAVPKTQKTPTKSAAKTKASPVVEPITEVVPVATAEKKPVRAPRQRKTTVPKTQKTPTKSVTGTKSTTNVGEKDVTA
jgi:small subunit ribosomal protein S3